MLASRLSALSDEVTLSQAGEMMGVSRASVARAAAVEKGPEPWRAATREGVVSVGDAYELRGEEPETIEQLVEDVRSGATPNLRAAMRQRLGLPLPRISPAGLRKCVQGHPNSSRSSNAKVMATSWV